MTPCARGCCFTGLQVCARAYQCRCHWEDRKPAPGRGHGYTHSDPTSKQAIKNVMKANRK